MPNGRTEADTCRTLITPRLQAAGWENDPHSIAEQRSFTDGRIVVRGNKAERRKGRRADYLLRYTRDFPIAVVEAKSEDEEAATGLQQSKDYAEILKLKFAYATNGREIIEFDYSTGLERKIQSFPTPAELWSRLRAHEKLGDDALVRLVNSMVEFKQIIGRGTRVRDDYGKLWFNIFDYTGTATRNFADPAFDGDPAFATQEEIDEAGRMIRTEILTAENAENAEPQTSELHDDTTHIIPSPPRSRRGPGRGVENTIRPLRADARSLVLRATAARRPEELHQNRAHPV